MSFLILFLISTCHTLPYTRCIFFTLFRYFKFILNVKLYFIFILLSFYSQTVYVFVNKRKYVSNFFHSCTYTISFWLSIIQHTCVVSLQQFFIASIFFFSFLFNSIFFNLICLFYLWLIEIYFLSLCSDDGVDGCLRKGTMERPKGEEMLNKRDCERLNSKLNEERLKVNELFYSYEFRNLLVFFQLFEI